AINIFLPASIIAIICQFAGGWLSDFIKLKYFLLFYMFAMLVTTTGLFLLTNHPVPYWLIITGNGISWGMYVLLVAVTWPRYYGLKNLGAISGYALSWMVIGSALGPYFFSLSYEYTGSFDTVAISIFSVSFLLFILAFRVNNPVRK
ncbi:MAG: hypothetical protein AMS27_16235, partial [Bacteroides sp. SM23_62_1]